MKQARATANPRCRGASPQTRKRATSTSQKSATTACRSSAPRCLHRHVRLCGLRQRPVLRPTGARGQLLRQVLRRRQRQQPDRGMAGDPIGPLEGSTLREAEPVVDSAPLHAKVPDRVISWRTRTPSSIGASGLVVERDVGGRGSLGGSREAWISGRETCDVHRSRTDSVGDAEDERNTRIARCSANGHWLGERPGGASGRSRGPVARAGGGRPAVAGARGGALWGLGRRALLGGPRPAPRCLFARAPWRLSYVRTGASSHRKGLSSLPLAAQGPVSEALGAEDPAYRVRRFERWALRRRAPRSISARAFAARGSRVSSGATRVGLSLRAVGYGASLSALGAVAPRVKANRVVYARAGLSEWYANGPLGLEQGFTIPRAPAGHPAGALTLSMALSGNAHASLASGGQSITFSRAGGPVLRYSGLSATDARGRALHSWLELQGGRILLRVDATGARYPLRIDPFVQQGEKLTGGGERGEEGDFGYSVALSPEGEYRADRRPPRQRRRRRGVGVHALGRRLDPAGRKAHRSNEEAGAGEFGKSVALSAEGRLHRADRRPRRQRTRRRGVGVHAHERKLDPAGRKAHREKRRRDRQPANSARAWRCPPKKATPR